MFCLASTTTTKTATIHPPTSPSHCYFHLHQDRRLILIKSHNVFPLQIGATYSQTNVQTYVVDLQVSEMILDKLNVFLSPHRI